MINLNKSPGVGLNLQINFSNDMAANGAQLQKHSEKEYFHIRCLNAIGEYRDFYAKVSQLLQLSSTSVHTILCRKTEKYNKSQEKASFFIITSQ